jgi:hypothetical protein
MGKKYDSGGRDLLRGSSPQKKDSRGFKKKIIPAEKRSRHEAIREKNIQPGWPGSGRRKNGANPAAGSRGKITCFSDTRRLSRTHAVEGNFAR